LRPGGYVVILQSGVVGVILAPVGLVLPGGGQDTGEAPESAAVRETAEECGLRVALVGHIGVADELVFAADEQVHYRKRCTFFRADLVGASDSGEPDHKWVWLPVGEAIDRLQFASQRWAVAEAIDAEQFYGL
jgi:8-oxo-dGTP pyrophosphatase MutT (NUDIX family)